MKRLDLFLYENGLFPSRDKAKEAILEGIISINKNICKKPSEKVEDNDIVEVVGQTLKYVSRAGLKLEKASQAWNIIFKEKTVLDVGASTGGFTDFSIQNGAKKVYAVDVGYGQLHQNLLNNIKVVNLEKTDFRNLQPIDETIDIAVCDCSFISLKLLSDKFAKTLNSGCELVVLIKPQFECGKEIAQKTKGVIKDQVLQEKIKDDIVSHFISKGFVCKGTCESPILGTKGNKEFLAYFIKK